MEKVRRERKAKPWVLTLAMPNLHRKIRGRRTVWVNVLAFDLGRISRGADQFLTCLWVGRPEGYYEAAMLAGEFTPRLGVHFRTQLESDICIRMRGGMKRDNSNRGMVVEFPKGAPGYDQPSAGPMTLITPSGGRAPMATSTPITTLPRQNPTKVGVLPDDAGEGTYREIMARSNTSRSNIHGRSRRTLMTKRPKNT